MRPTVRSRVRETRPAGSTAKVPIGRRFGSRAHRPGAAGRVPTQSPLWAPDRIAEPLEPPGRRPSGPHRRPSTTAPIGPSRSAASSASSACRRALGDDADAAVGARSRPSRRGRAPSPGGRRSSGTRRPGPGRGSSPPAGRPVPGPPASSVIAADASASGGAGCRGRAPVGRWPRAARRPRRAGRGTPPRRAGRSRSSRIRRQSRRPLRPRRGGRRAEPGSRTWRSSPSDDEQEVPGQLAPQPDEDRRGPASLGRRHRGLRRRRAPRPRRRRPPSPPTLRRRREPSPRGSRRARRLAPVRASPARRPERHLGVDSAASAGPIEGARDIGCPGRQVADRGEARCRAAGRAGRAASARSRRGRRAASGARASVRAAPGRPPAIRASRAASGGSATPASRQDRLDLANRHRARAGSGRARDRTVGRRRSSSSAQRTIVTPGGRLLERLEERGLGVVGQAVGPLDDRDARRRPRPASGRDPTARRRTVPSSGPVARPDPDLVAGTRRREAMDVRDAGRARRGGNRDTPGTAGRAGSGSSHRSPAARSRASVVLPIPAGPLIRIACGTRPATIARTLATARSWPRVRIGPRRRRAGRAATAVGTAPQPDGRRVAGAGPVTA